MDHLLMRLPSLEALPAMPDVPEGYILREYEERDLNGLAAMLQLAFAEDNWRPQVVQERLIDAPDVQKTYVIEYAGKPVATASERIMPEQFPDSGYLHWVAVHPDHRGKRLGETVTLAVLADFARMGCKDAVLETEDHRLPAIKLYKRLGFEEVHKHHSHSLRWAMVADLLSSANL